MKVTGVPEQEPLTGVTVIVPVIAADVEFVAVNAAMFPLPLVPTPIVVFELDQL